jgi:hypothetical protein
MTNSSTKNSPVHTTEYWQKGFIMGNPWVFSSDPRPRPPVPVAISTGAGYLWARAKGSREPDQRVIVRRNVLALVGHCAWVGMILANTATVAVFVVRSWSFDGVYIWTSCTVRTCSGDTLLQRSKGYSMMIRGHVKYSTPSWLHVNARTEWQSASVQVNGEEVTVSRHRSSRGS